MTGGAAPAMLFDEHDQFVAVWEHAADAMALSDAEGRVLAANPAYYELYGYRPDEILGRSFALIFPPEEQAQAEAQYRALFAGADQAPAFEATVCRADGTTRLVEARYAFTMRAGRRTAMLSIIRDITERTVAEAALRARTREAELGAAVGAALTAGETLRSSSSTVLKRSSRISTRPSPASGSSTSASRCWSSRPAPVSTLIATVRTGGCRSAPIRSVASPPRASRI